MEKYLFFAEADVETGDDNAPEALLVPASSFIEADPLNSTTTTFKFRAPNSQSTNYEVRVNHGTNENKTIIKQMMALMNAKGGGFVEVANMNTAALTTGEIQNPIFNGGITGIAITGSKNGGVIGISGGTSIPYSYGAGMVSTETTPKYYRELQGNTIVTTVLIDLTGLGNKNDVDDVIGLTAGGAAYFYKNVTTQNGVISKVEMTCLELPTASSNVGLDIDIVSSNNATRAYDFDLSGGTSILASGGDLALGNTIQSLTTNGASNDYYYLTTGGTHTGDSVYTAGKLMVKFYGHPSF
jgi:hypothetical protein